MSGKADVRLTVSVKDDTFGSPCMTFRADVAVMTGEGLRNPVWHDYSDRPADAFDSLAVTAQCDRRGEFYGYQVRYLQPYDVSLQRAESMVKVLRKVRRHLEQLTAKYGAVTDLASFTARVADAIGASGRPFGWRVPREKDFDGSGYRWADTDGLRYWLNDQVRAFRARHGATEEGGQPWLTGVTGGQCSAPDRGQTSTRASAAVASRPFPRVRVC